MIPVQLTLSGFLSYRERVSIDFRAFEMACITGHNGAGKSSLLDAITWALFGEARQKGEALLNSTSPQAEVEFIFEYESNTYRVQRILPRGKNALLEFQIRAADRWRPLSEKSLSQTEKRIEHILRLDYETFVNASFFLQGKADQFTQQRAADRKRILASILGLEQWENYRQRASEKRREKERDLAITQSELSRLQKELDEEPARKARLEELEARLKEKEEHNQTLYQQVQEMKQREAGLKKQRELTQRLEEMWNTARFSWKQAQTRAQTQRQREQELRRLLEEAPAIEAAFSAWNASRSALEKWDLLAQQYHALEKRLAPLRQTLSNEEAQLKQESLSLQKRAQEMQAISQHLPAWQKDLEQKQALLQQARAQKQELEEQRNTQEERKAQLAALQAQNNSLRSQMTPIEERIKKLASSPQGVCPLCGQDLSAEHRAESLAQLEAEGKALGDTFRANKSQIEHLEAEIQQAGQKLQKMKDAESAAERLNAEISGLEERLKTAHQNLTTWQKEGAPRLEEIQNLLSGAAFGAAERAQIAQLESQQKALGYDASAHQKARQKEQEGRASQEKRLRMEKARSELEVTEKALQDAEAALKQAENQRQNSEASYLEAKASLDAALGSGPSLEKVETEYFRAKEAENALRAEVGSARQQVETLKRVREQKAQQNAAREEQARAIEHFKTLERAFGKDGVPALMIEQALPQIEDSANRLLDRLSGGAMSVRFATQAEYKDKKREGLKETLDILISDPAGTRAYELFSGGEAFRVNFAIRLALSEVLAKRSGARLQMLVIDEGFGSQDTQGVQRLIEAINAVRHDFAKILVITHLEELKDAFSSRIDVEKTPQGSRVKAL